MGVGLRQEYRKRQLILLPGLFLVKKKRQRDRKLKTERQKDFLKERLKHRNAEIQDKRTKRCRTKTVLRCRGSFVLFERFFLHTLNTEYIL